MSRLAAPALLTSLAGDLGVLVVVLIGSSGDPSD